MCLGLRSVTSPPVCLCEKAPCNAFSPLLQVGEMMDGRYEVFATHGKGVFSTVLRARDKGHTDALGRHPEVPPEQLA